jgi:hypothetical protein
LPPLQCELTRVMSLEAFGIKSSGKEPVEVS